MSDNDDNPFGGLDEDPDDERVDEQDEAATETTADTVENKADEPESEPVEPLQQPAFEYDKDIREYFYARPETWGRFEDIIYDAEGHLRREYDLRDVPKRELHEAAMSVFLSAVEYGEVVSAKAIAEQVVDERVDGNLEQADV